MQDVAAIVAPIFGLILLGAAARMRRLLDIAGLRALNDVTFFLLIPALLFGSVAEAPDLNILGLATLYFAAAFAIFALATVLSRGLGAPLAEAGMAGMNACYGNTVMLGIPLVSAAFGPPGLAILLPVIALHSILLLPLATIVIEAGGQGAARPAQVIAATARSIGRNPIILALAAALLWRALGIPVPGPLHRLLAMLAGAAPTLALFALGASLPDFAVQGTVQTTLFGAVRQTALASGLKLIAQPLLVWALALAAGVGPLATAVLVITAGTPTGANAFFLARRSQVSAAASAGIVVVSTALSVVTLSMLLRWVRP